jgi:hypothetical protein
MLFPILIIVLTLLLYNEKIAIVTVLLTITNIGEFIAFSNWIIFDTGIGTIYFFDAFWISVILITIIKRKHLNVFVFHKLFNFFILLFSISIFTTIFVGQYTIKDIVSVIRPFGNLLLIPLTLVTIRDQKKLDFFINVIYVFAIVFFIIQLYEFLIQERIPFRLFQPENTYFGEMGSYMISLAPNIKTFYAWSRITYLLPIILFISLYGLISGRNKSINIIITIICLLAIIISLSRTWTLGLIVLGLVLIFLSQQNEIKLFKILKKNIIYIMILLVVVYFSFSQFFENVFSTYILRLDSLNDIISGSDNSYLTRLSHINDNINNIYNYPLFGSGFTSISRNLTTFDLGIWNFIAIFGLLGALLYFFIFINLYTTVRKIKNINKPLFISSLSVMSLLMFMSLLSIDFFYYNFTGVFLLGIINVHFFLTMKDSIYAVK